MEALKYIGIIYAQAVVISFIIAGIIWAVNVVLTSDKINKNK